MTEQDFASILGIIYSDYKKIKYKIQKVKIKFIKKQLDRIKNQLSESKEYSRAELEDICNKYGITVYELLKSIYGNESVVDRLSNRNSIYIGKCEIPKEFREKYAKRLLDISKEISRKITKKYNLIRYADDFSSDILMYILQNKGDIVKNSENEEIAIDYIIRYIAVYIKYKCVNELKLKHISLNSPNSLSNNYPKEIGDFIVDTSVDIEDEVEKSIIKEEYNIKGIFEKMKEYYSKGMNNTQVIKKIIEEYKISREDLLLILEELTKQKANIELEDERNSH